MKKTILLYGVVLSLLAFAIKSLEYHYVVHNLFLEFYLGLTALLFAGVGVWVGFKLHPSKSLITIAPNESTLPPASISKRELEVLKLMAEGLSNQEIADHLFVSLNTVKTHSSNIFSKLGVKRRTQAIQKARALRLIL